MGERLNLKTIVMGKDKKWGKLFLVIIGVLFLIVVISSGGKDKSGDTAKFETPGERVNGDSEIQRILEELKKQEMKYRRKGGSEASAAHPSKIIEERKDQLLPEQKVLEEKIKKFQLEKKEKELEVQKLQLEAKLLEALARIKAARKKLWALEAEKSSEILVYQAEEEKEQPSDSKVVDLGEEIIVPAGTFVDAIVQNRIEVNSGETSSLVAFVDHDVPDIYHRGKFYFLRGTKFVGETVNFTRDANRLTFVFHTMILPDGTHIPLKGGKEVTDVMDTSGARGTASSVNRHFLSLLTRAALVGILEAGTVLTTPYGGVYYGISPFGLGTYGGGWNGYGEFYSGEERKGIAKELALRSVLNQMTEGARNMVSSYPVPKTTIKVEAGTRIKLFFPRQFSYKL